MPLPQLFHPLHRFFSPCSLHYVISYIVHRHLQSDHTRHGDHPPGSTQVVSSRRWICFWTNGERLKMWFMQFKADLCLLSRKSTMTYWLKQPCIADNRYNFHKYVSSWNVDIAFPSHCLLLPTGAWQIDSNWKCRAQSANVRYTTSRHVTRRESNTCMCGTSYENSVADCGIIFMNILYAMLARDLIHFFLLRPERCWATRCQGHVERNTRIAEFRIVDSHVECDLPPWRWRHRQATQATPRELYVSSTFATRQWRHMTRDLLSSSSWVVVMTSSDRSATLYRRCAETTSTRDILLSSTASCRRVDILRSHNGMPVFVFSSSVIPSSRLDSAQSVAWDSVASSVSVSSLADRRRQWSSVTWQR